MKKINTLLLIFSIFIGKLSAQQNVADFENLSLEPESYWDGSDLSGTSLASKYYTEFSSGDITLNNTFSGGYWADDWLYSNSEDDTTSGYGNLHSCIAGMGANSSANYVIGGNKSFMKIDTSSNSNDSLIGIYITNTTYAHNSMRDGDQFAKKFTNVDQDFFKLTIYSIDGGLEQDSIVFVLADFTHQDSTEDYIVDEWKFVDLSSFGVVDSLMFSLSSSDIGDWGMNTPAYFALDDVKIGDTTFGFENLELEENSFFNGSDLSGTPDNHDYFATFNSGNVNFNNTWNSEYDYWKSGWIYSNTTDTTTTGFTNLSSSKAGSGYLESENYALGKSGSKIVFDSPTNFTAFISNSTYAANSMRDGDNIAKKFSNQDQDYFKLIFHGYADGQIVDSSELYLADFTHNDSTLDYIINITPGFGWQYIELPLFPVDSVIFLLESSDVGNFGMNTPDFFCIDNIGSYPLSINKYPSSNFEIYPNPSSDFIKFKDIGYESSYKVNIYDIYGRIIISNSNSPKELNISSLIKGQYIVQIISEEDNFNEVFIKN